ncbi:MAG TPA: hypothetical protein DGT21_12985 [Armatimonadetes bacterium]|jgi:hypothetical protein|nr:hypothetical protein [Armatimonadota bacterium]
MNRILLGAFCLLAATAAVSAETLDAGPFSVDITSRLLIRYEGQTLIEGDRCVAFRAMRPGEPVLVDPAAGRVLRDGNVLTTLAQQDRNSLRREVMVTPDAVHITFELQAFGPTGGSHLQYDLLTPPEYLDGIEYEAWTGAPRGPLRQLSGTFSIANSKADDYLIRSTRYIILKRPGATCSLDFNPDGPWVGESNYGHAFSSNPYHDGRRFHFLMLCAGAKNGAVFRGKIIIRPGAQTYASLHSTGNVAYTTGFAVSLGLNFSEGPSTEPYVSYAPGAPPAASHRWRNPEKVRIFTRDSGGMLYRDFATSVGGESRATLRLQQRSGWYLMTLSVRDPDATTGPFTISGPDGVLVGDVSVKAGDYWCKTVPLRFRNGAVDLRFTGDWKVGALALQPIVYETEDFVLEGRWWNMDISEAQ